MMETKYGTKNSCARPSIKSGLTVEFIHNRMITIPKIDLGPFEHLSI